MRSTVFAMALMGVVGVVNAAEPLLVGCFEAPPGSLKFQTVIEFNSKGSCRVKCVDEEKAKGKPGYAVIAMQNTDCWCGQKLPNLALKVDSKKCKQGCPGFNEPCGDRIGEYFSVYTSGEEDQPDQDPLPSSTQTTASKTSTTEQPEDTTTGTSTKTDGDAASATASTEPTEEPEKEESSGVNKAAVAAGCVVAVLAIIGISVGAFIIMRKRRRQKVEEDFRRSAAVREFSQKPASDHRLDPGMVQRRDSVGSIADNQDYSRRILKVTNPDGN